MIRFDISVAHYLGVTFFVDTVYKRLFVCINSEFVSVHWTPTGAVNTSVSGAQMLNHLYRTISHQQISHEAYVCYHKDVYTISIYITFITVFRYLQH